MRILAGLLAGLVLAGDAVAATLSPDEMTAFSEHLSQCWTPPAGWTDPAQVRVVLFLSLNADGSLDRTPQVLEAPSGAYAVTAPESAIEAARRCAPFTLPVGNYAAWREVRVTFDATEVTTSSASTETLALSGDSWWVAVASRQDLDEAITLANIYAAQHSRVVKAKNGWFAIALGPYATTDISQFRASYVGPALPHDAMLTRGTGYVATVWQPPETPETPVPSVAGPVATPPVTVAPPPPAVALSLPVDNNSPGDGEWFWSADKKAAKDDAQCQSIGAMPGTPVYVQCRLMKDQQRAGTRSDRSAAAARNFNNTINLMNNNRPRNCVSSAVGNTLQTHCY